MDGRFHLLLLHYNGGVGIRDRSGLRRPRTLRQHLHLQLPSSHQPQNSRQYPSSHIELGIRAVMTTARGLLLPYSKEQLPNYLYLPVDDTPEQQLGKFLGPAFDFIEKNRARTNVLVHCYSGISRSAAFIIAYLMRKYGYAFNQSHLLIKRRKRRVLAFPSRSSLIHPSSDSLKSIS